MSHSLGDALRSGELGPILRFVGSGAVNTVLTGILVSLLSLIMEYRLAYTISFMLGIALSVALAGAFVFKSHFTTTRIVAYVAMYLLLYLVGLGALSLADRWGMPHALNGGVVLITAPLSYVGGRYVFWGRGRRPARTVTDSERLPR